MTTFPDNARDRLTAYLETPGRIIAEGLGTRENACSIAAINLALDGRLTDHIPNCMSFVIGSWILSIQDFMPHECRNSQQWRALLPLAAGSGRDPDAERQRLRCTLDWMWSTVLPHLQPLADSNGFGPDWAAMTRTRTAAESCMTALAARKVAEARKTTPAARKVAEAACNAATAASHAACAASCYTCAHDHAEAADAAAHAAAHAADAARPAEAAAWNHFNPVHLLERLVQDHQ